ncbi:hypothetical protein PFISCL1PPCAC_6792, partial [Pristionchus fissidentatus]
LTRMRDDRSDKHASRVHQHWQSEEEERIDDAHLQVRRKKQAEERHAHMADTDIHSGMVCVSTVTFSGATVARAASFSESAVAPAVHHRMIEGI